MHKEIIYKKGCLGCNKKYIGETGQTLKERDILHKSDIKTAKERSALYIHIRDNKDHVIDWENQTIIDRESNFIKRRIKEALCIQASDNGTLINTDKGTPINDSWKIFYQDIRKSMNKKMWYKDNS